MGIWKRDGTHSPSKNELVQDSEGNEENRHPDPDSSKTKINYNKEPNEAHKNPWKKILQVINEKFMEIVKQKVHEAHKKF
jgi:hypothetical protein